MAGSSSVGHHHDDYDDFLRFLSRITPPRITVTMDSGLPRVAPSVSYNIYLILVLKNNRKIDRIRKVSASMRAKKLSANFEKKVRDSVLIRK